MYSSIFRIQKITTKLLNQWCISRFLVRERLFLSSNLTRESQGCLRVTLQQILVPRAAIIMFSATSTAGAKNRGPRLETKKVTILVPRTHRFFWSHGIKTESLWRREWELPNTVARYTHVQRALCHTSVKPIPVPRNRRFFGHLVLKRGAGLSRIALRMRMEHSRPLGGDKQVSEALARAEAGSAQNF